MLAVFLCLSVFVPHLLAVLANPEVDENQPNSVVYESYLNQSYYQDFPPHAVNFRPRMQKNFQYQEDEREDNLAEYFEILHPSRTMAEKLEPRATFSYICPTSIQCSDAGCCPIGTWCTIVDGLAGYCDLPMSVPHAALQ